MVVQGRKNRTKAHFRRNDLFRGKILPEMLEEANASEEMDLDLSEGHVQDSQLRMVFAVCTPDLPAASRIALALRYLGGFSGDEIAHALLSQKSTIQKRLHRAKEKLRASEYDLQAPIADLAGHLPGIHSILYLLFNEGYFSSHSETKIRHEICFEAMRLAQLLTRFPATSTPETHALLALFCFHAFRFAARTGAQGEQVLYGDQNPADWNAALIAQGERFLFRSAQGDRISKYHCQAAIAFWHTRTDTERGKKWANVLAIYNRLLQIEYSPVAALNRTYALARVWGPEAALKEALKIDLGDQPLYHALLGELYAELDGEKSRQHRERAVALSKNENDRAVLRRKLEGE